MKKKVVAVDFDDVVYDCNTTLALWHNGAYGSNYTRDDVRSWHLWHTWECSEEEAVRRVEEFLLSDAHDTGLPVSGSLEALKAIALQYELHIITARSDHHRPKVMEWLAHHLPGVFHAAHFTNYWLKDAAVQRSKRQVCSELSAVCLIEDSMHNAHDVAESNTPVLLFDTPWNKTFEPHPLVTRVYSWKEIQEKVARLT